MAFVHAGSIPSSTLMIAGVAAIAGGGTVAIAHGTIIGLRKYTMDHYLAWKVKESSV